MPAPQDFTPIPTPPAQRWRQLRLVYLPWAVFLLGALLVAWMWQDAVAPATMVAEAETLAADVRAPQAGIVAALKVQLNQPVRAGEVIGQVAAANPRLLDSTLAVIRAEIALVATTMAGATDQQRVAMEFERIQLDWMGHRIDRVALQGKLQQAVADLARAEPLHKAGLISDEAYETLRITRASLENQIAETTQLVSRLENVFRQRNAADPQVTAINGDPSLKAAIAVQEAKLRLAEAQLAPLPLVAPIDGVVSLVSRQVGEGVQSGDAVLRVIATKPARLTGYLRQPLPFQPKLGMVAEIRTRRSPSVIASSKITQIAAGLEPLPLTLHAAMNLPASVPTESALRIELALPSGLALLPGEHVDVVVK
jgi:multidrug resistance efflux pump